MFVDCNPCLLRKIAKEEVAFKTALLDCTVVGTLTYPSLCHFVPVVLVQNVHRRWRWRRFGLDKEVFDSRHCCYTAYRHVTDLEIAVSV